MTSNNCDCELDFHIQDKIHKFLTGDKGNLCFDDNCNCNIDEDCKKDVLSFNSDDCLRILITKVEEDGKFHIQLTFHDLTKKKSKKILEEKKNARIKFTMEAFKYSVDWDTIAFKHRAPYTQGFREKIEKELNSIVTNTCSMRLLTPITYKPFLEVTLTIKSHLVEVNREARQLVHRLVAETFVKNPDMYKYVKHINGDTTDNNATNLLWVESGGDQELVEKFKKEEQEKNMNVIKRLKDYISELEKTF